MEDVKWLLEELDNQYKYVRSRKMNYIRIEIKYNYSKHQSTFVSSDCLWGLLQSLNCFAEHLSQLWRMSLYIFDTLLLSP